MVSFDGIARLMDTVLLMRYPFHFFFDLPNDVILQYFQ